MTFAGVNTLGILGAAIAGYVFGAVYYMLLAKSWMAAVGKTEDEIKANMSAVPYIVAFVCQLIMAIMLAGVVAHLGDKSMTVRNATISAFFIWLGFVVTTLAVNHAFQGAKRSLTAIDGAHWLGVLLIQGVVLGLFGS